MPLTALEPFCNRQRLPHNRFFRFCSTQESGKERRFTHPFFSNDIFQVCCVQYLVAVCPAMTNLALPLYTGLLTLCSSLSRPDRFLVLSGNHHWA